MSRHQQIGRAKISWRSILETAVWGTLLWGARGAAAAQPNLTALTPSVGRRFLKQSAGPASGDVVCTAARPGLPRCCRQSDEYIQTLPAELQSIYRGRVWRAADAALTLEPPAEELVFPYTFDNPLLDTDPYNTTSLTNAQALLPLPQKWRPTVHAVIKELSQLGNLRFREVANGTNETAALFFRLDRSPFDAGASYFTTDGRGLIAYVEQANYGDNLEAVGNTARHELMHFVGGCHPFEDCRTSVTLPNGFFLDVSQSTALSYNTSCNGQLGNEGYGALDYSLVTVAYGARARPAAAEAVDLRDGDLSTGLIDPVGQLPLRAISDDPVVVSLLSNGEVASRVGYTQFLLAPLSRTLDADLRQTPGGYAIGNDDDNHIWAGSTKTIIDGRLGSDTITLSAGADIIIARAGIGLLTIENFTPGNDSLVNLIGGAAPSLFRTNASAAGETINLAFTGGERVRLYCDGPQFTLTRHTLRQDPLPNLGACVDRQAIFAFDWDGSATGPSTFDEPPPAPPVGLGGGPASGPSAFTEPPPPPPFEVGSAGGLSSPSSLGFTSYAYIAVVAGAGLALATAVGIGKYMRMQLSTLPMPPVLTPASVGGAASPPPMSQASVNLGAPPSWPPPYTPPQPAPAAPSLPIMYWPGSAPADPAPPHRAQAYGGGAWR